MKRISIVLTLILVLVFVLASCSQSKQPSKTEVKTEAKTENVTKPITEPISEKTTNLETAPSTEDTRPLSTVRWVLDTGVVTTEVREGDVPVPPAGATKNVETVSQVKTFIGWSPELKVVPEGNTKAIVYTANYSTSARVYNVDFKINGQTVATVPTEYGSVPQYKGQTLTKTGYTSIAWVGGNVPVSGDGCVVNGIFCNQDPEQVAWSMAREPSSFTTGQNDNWCGWLNDNTAMLYLTMEVRRAPAGENENVRYIEQILTLLRARLTDAPFFSLEPYWAYVSYTGAIAVMKETPEIWNRLTATEKERCDFQMKCFAYVLTFGTSDQNLYLTGPGFRGNYKKTWNPNYRFATVLPMLFIGRYFEGAANVDSILASFSYDDTIAKFTEYGYTRAYAEWTAEPPTLAGGVKAPNQKTLMENGGTAYYFDGNKQAVDGGSGMGVRVSYRYNGNTLDNPSGIFNSLLNYCYSGGKVVSSFGDDGTGKPLAYIMDGSKSPLEGQIGMMREFAAGDGGGIRSSCDYTMYDFILVQAGLTVMGELGMYDLTDSVNSNYYHLVWIGNTDFLYKYSVGYRSYSTGRGYDTKEYDYEGYYVWKALWLADFGEVTLEDFKGSDTGSYVLYEESFEGVTFEATVSKTSDIMGGTSGKQLNFNAKKNGSSFVTVSEADNTYVLAQIVPSGGDPQINFDNSSGISGGLAGAVGEATAASFSFDLAIAEGYAAPNVSLRVRGSSPWVILKITDKNKVTTPSGVEAGTLTTSFQTVVVTVDFKANVLSIQVGDGEAVAETFAEGLTRLAS